jgi:transposase
LVLEFFLALDDFLNQADIPKKHRRVLEMYSSGMHKKEISAHVQMSYAWVRLVIDKYELLILSTY